ncbi:hypothetical protein EP7_005095 [Isosphaeraceae bacterium EP7]
MRVTRFRWWAVTVVATLAAWPAPVWAQGRPQKGRAVAETIAYRGWKDNLRIANGDAELIVTLEVGPRILSYRLADGVNVFKEFEGHLGKSGEAGWLARGGHRLWSWPEDPKRTYYPDNGPVAHREVSPGVIRFTPAPDGPFGLRREFDVALAPSGSKVTITHRIHNLGDTPTELAPWALTVMAPGGVEVIPLPPKRPHPGGPENARSAADFAPSQVLAVWPFFDFKDPRWTFGSDAILLRQDPAAAGPTKLGLANTAGAVAYLNKGTLFIKRFPYDANARYPDGGVNYETFSNADMAELESLGPVVTLAPGHFVEHVERWELIGGLPATADSTAIEADVLPRIR